MVSTVQAHIKKLNFFYENGVKAPQKIDGPGVWYFNALARFEGVGTLNHSVDIVIYIRVRARVRARVRVRGTIKLIL